MKLTVTPAWQDDEPASNLDALARLIQGAHTAVRAAGGDPATCRARTVINLRGAVKAVELSW